MRLAVAEAAGDGMTTGRHAAAIRLAERLEAARRPELAELIGSWLRLGFANDVDFNARAGLPGGEREIALFHYALDGLMLDRLTVSIDPDTPTDDVVDALVEGLLPR